MWKSADNTIWHRWSYTTAQTACPLGRHYGVHSLLSLCTQTFLFLSEQIKWQRVLSPHINRPHKSCMDKYNFYFFDSLGCSSVCPSEFRVLLSGDVPLLQSAARVFGNPTKLCGHLNNMCDCLTVSMVTSGLAWFYLPVSAVSTNQCLIL